MRHRPYRRLLTPFNALAGAAVVVMLALATGTGSGGAAPAAPGAAGMGPTELSTPVKPRVVTGEPTRRQYHEFQTNCTISHVLPDDPIVFPGQPGASHSHTFFGNRTTTATSTVSSLAGGATSCVAPGDKAAYWMPTFYAGDTVLTPDHTVIYYKSGVNDYREVQPFPRGFRFVIGDAHATSDAEFRTHGYWSCTGTGRTYDIVQSCSRAAGQKVYARLWSPSCWDGVHLDSPDHKSHVTWPVSGACPASHPVALPMLEFKIPYLVGGKTGTLRLSTGAGYTFHFDFVNLWDDATQAAMVGQCINIGLQCDNRGYDEFYPQYAPVLDEHYLLQR